MSGVFQGAMGKAAVVLFVLSIIVLVAGLYSAWRGMSVAAELTARLEGVMPGGMLAASPRANWVQAITSALNAAALPFFGAALLWRLDRLALDRRA